MIHCAETLIEGEFDVRIHPVGGRIFLLPPDVIAHLYSGNSIELVVAKRRSLAPLIIGVMAMNSVTAKNLSKSYPDTLIDPVLWRPEYVEICRQLVFKTENGIEASLCTLSPCNFVYLRVSNTAVPADQPVIRVTFDSAVRSTVECRVIS